MYSYKLHLKKEITKKDLLMYSIVLEALCYVPEGLGFETR
jgi:hypothetical protein